MPLVAHLYPPYLGTGIRVTHVSKDFRSIRVRMPLRFYNRNYFGTHFGGSLYAMCDPFYMWMLIKNLGPDYIVWDESASIRYFRPGRGVVTARFELYQQQIEALRRVADSEGSAEDVFSVDITDEQGQVVAQVGKRIHVRRKKRA
jgi:acyl-coenzyme A thioesterase PaaI-like protein